MATKTKVRVASSEAHGNGRGEEADPGEKRSHGPERNVRSELQAKGRRRRTRTKPGKEHLDRAAREAQEEDQEEENKTRAWMRSSGL